MDYSIKARQINPTTVIYVMDVELLDWSEIKNYWCIRFLVPISEACSMSFHDFLEKFIRRVLITDIVLSSIWRFWSDGVSKQDRPTRYSWPAAHIARYVKRFHDPQEHHCNWTWWSFFDEAILNDEPDLAMFRYKKRQENCEPRKFGSWYQIAGSKTCVLNIQSYR